MKKIFAFVMAFSICFSMAACGRAVQENTTAEKEQPGSQPENVQTEYDAELYTLFENLVNTVQPGTAGSSLKAVYAARDLLAWVKDNYRDTDPQTVVNTVRYFFENSGLAADAAQAFRDIKNVFTTLLESDAAQSLLDTVGMAVEDFEMPAEITELINSILDEAEKYYGEKTEK